jgi:hypothetical protein
MMEKERRGTNRVLVEMELVKEEYYERSETDMPCLPWAGHKSASL